jgi:hypothetical protein
MVIIIPNIVICPQSCQREFFSGKTAFAATWRLNWCFSNMPTMSKRKVQISISVVLVAMFAGVLIGTFSQPARSDVRVIFMGFTNSPSQFFGSGVSPMFTNASFCVSNASASVTTPVNFRDYEASRGTNTAFLSFSGSRTLCVLKPGQSTNLIFLFLPQVDERWRIRLSSSRNRWITKLGQQPVWVQNIAIKVIPVRWLAGLNQPDIVSDWVTNGEPKFVVPELNPGRR